MSVEELWVNNPQMALELQAKAENELNRCTPQSHPMMVRKFWLWLTRRVFATAYNQDVSRAVTLKNLSTSQTNTAISIAMPG